MLRILIDNRYAIVGLLGCGGMAKVYLARDEFLGRDVALKVLKEEYAFSEEFRERFRREAENAASLSHPNIVAVYDRGKDGPGSMPYIVMEHVPGGTLAERIVKEGSLDVLEAAGIARQVALALAEAHRHGVIHRDIKPHNIFLTRDPFDSVGAVKVGDFGIARALKATTVTDTTFILGSVRYLSPEQAMGEPVGPRSDLYSLGVVLYEMLTGRVPFNGEGPIAIAMKHISELPPSPKQANPDVPESLEAVTQRLLSKDPAFRYPDALALAEDLAGVARGLRSGAFALSPSGGGAFSGGSLSTDRANNRNTVDSKTRRRRRDLRRRLSATMVGVAALIFAAGASAAAGLYGVPWLADVRQLSGWLTTRSGEETSSPAEKASLGEEASSPAEEASSEPQAGAQTKTGANTSTANLTSGEESSTTITPTTPEGWSAVEPVAYVTSTNPQIQTSKSEPTSAKSTPKQGEQQRRKDSLETTSNSTEKTSKGVLRSNPGEGTSVDRHVSAQGKTSKKASRATSKK
jgi:serine/threonine-protein kinase